eukprot:scaffold1782_cov414-Prasinococcus_capsulatus_cf.AAC.10
MARTATPTETEEDVVVTAEHIFIQVGVTLANRRPRRVRALMSRGYMPETKAKALYKAAARIDDGIVSFVLAGRLYKLRLWSARSQGDKTTYLGVVNLHNDDHSQLATHLTEQQIAYARALFEEIKDSEEQALTAIDCLNLKLRQPDGTQPAEGEEPGLTQIVADMSGGDKEFVLNHLVGEGWLYSEGGQVSFGPRAQLELHAMLET